jgi:chromate transporter
MMKDVSFSGINTISFINLLVIAGTFALLYFTKIPSTVIVMIILLLGWIIL